MSKLKIPRKKKAMDENTISKPKRSLRSKHKRKKVKKSHPHKQEKAKKSRPKRGQKYIFPRHARKNISCVTFGRNFLLPKKGHLSKKTKPFQPKREA